MHGARAQLAYAGHGRRQTTIALDVLILILAAVWHGIGFVLRRKIPEKNVAYRWSSSSNGRSRRATILRRGADVLKNTPRVFLRWFYATGRSRRSDVGDVCASGRPGDPAAFAWSDRLRLRSSGPDRRNQHDGHVSAGNAAAGDREIRERPRSGDHEDRRDQVGKLDGRAQAGGVELGDRRQLCASQRADAARAPPRHV